MATVEELDLQIEALNYAFDMISKAYGGNDPADSETETQSNHRTTLIAMRLDLLKQRRRLTKVA